MGNIARQYKLYRLGVNVPFPLMVVFKFLKELKEKMTDGKIRFYDDGNTLMQQYVDINDTNYVLMVTKSKRTSLFEWKKVSIYLNEEVYDNLFGLYNDDDLNSREKHEILIKQMMLLFNVLLKKDEFHEGELVFLVRENKNCMHDFDALLGYRWMN